MPWLFIHRSVSHPEDPAFSRAFTRGEATITDLARVEGSRWTSEAGFQQAEEVGLDQDEVRRWAEWYRSTSAPVTIKET